MVPQAFLIAYIPSTSDVEQMIPCSCSSCDSAQQGRGRFHLAAFQNHVDACRLHQTHYSVVTVVTESEMISERYVFDYVSVAGCILRSIVAKLAPIATSVQLAISHCLVAKCVQRGIVRVTDHRLPTIRKIAQSLPRPGDVCIPAELRQSSARYGTDDKYTVVFPRPPRMFAVLHAGSGQRS
jgi:hypothetical protein